MEQTGHKTISVGRKQVDLYMVAKTQRTLLWLILLYLIIQIGGNIFYGYLARGAAAAGVIAISSYALPLVILAAYLIIGVIAVVTTVQLAHRTGRSMVIVVITAIVLLVPCLNVIWLAGINGLATCHLQQAGVKVGFMGVSTKEMNKLVEGICKECGYDIRGLTSNTCPECGVKL